MGQELFENEIDDELIAVEEEPKEEKELETEVDTPLTGSPLYPRIYLGDSAKPLMGQFPESEYVDDNISRMYMGLMSGFLG